MKNSILFLIVFLFISMGELKAQEITMFPGFFGNKFYQEDVQISKQEAYSLLENDTEAADYLKKSKRNLAISYVAVGAELGFLIWQGNRANNNESQIVPLVGVLATGGVAIGFAFSSSNMLKKSILKYNQNADVGYLNFGPTYNGVGLVLGF